MNSRELTMELKRRAWTEGFTAVGIAPAGRLDRDGAALAAWLRHDHHAAMTWMARDPERRTDPRRLLPGCSSVVALAMNYWPGPERTVPVQGAARVALYACSRDYHRVLGKKVKSLALWLAETTGLEARSFVDTGPVLERAWAERAGIGWIGKNGNLLTADQGSWLLLGEVLSVAELEADPGPHAEQCGSCTACLDACPTRAIVDPGVVDSNRCISYWTIEHRGEIPSERREGIGNWIFGCDVCQEVCPWNQSFARPAEEDVLGYRSDLSELDPVAILELDEETFRERYSGTALMRAKWQGMRRNACVVLGNRGDRSSLQTLARALVDVDPVVRSHSAWAVGRIGGQESRRLLESAARNESSAEVLGQIRESLLWSSRLK